MSDVVTTVDTYLAMWNETDAARRAEQIARAWAADGRYVDPMLEAEGHAALGEMVAAVQARFPGHRFYRTSGVDVHHDQVRFAWELRGPDGAVAPASTSAGSRPTDASLASRAFSVRSRPWPRPDGTDRRIARPRPAALVLHSPS